MKGVYKHKAKDLQRKAIYESIANLKEKGGHGFFCEMGTGKTLMALYASMHMHTKGYLDTVIIISPKSLQNNWLQEINKHLNIEIRPFIFSSNMFTTKRKAFMFESTKKKKLKIYLINLEIFSVKNKARETFLSTLKEDKTILILDESSKIKGYNANRSKALVALASKFKYKLILTGTEISNSILDLFMQMLFLEQDFWGRLSKKYFYFRAYYAMLETKYTAGGRTYKKVVGFQKINELTGKINPWISRIRKKDMLDLPDKIFDVIYLDMPSETEDFYFTLKEKLKAEYEDKKLTVVNKSVLFIKFRMICAGCFKDNENKTYHFKENPKLQFVLDEAEDHNKKFLVWSSFVKEIEQYLFSLEKNKIKARSFYGGLVEKKRQANIEEFKNASECRALIINPQAGAFGLNLQFCDLAYYTTLPTSVDQFLQSQDRLHRMGQKNHPQYKILLYRNTVDENIFIHLMELTCLIEDFKNGVINDTVYTHEKEKKSLMNIFKNGTIEDFFKLI